MEEERPKLLIVDDEHNTREAMARYLGRRYRVTTAADGGDALEKLAGEKFDLVLTDLRMPKHDGMEVLEVAKAQPDPPSCVLLTAYGSIEDAVAAVKQGAFDFVTKPVKLDKLESVIRAALEERRKHPAEPAEGELVEERAPEAVTHVPALLELHGPTELTPEYILPEPAEGSGPMAEVMRLVNTVAPTRSTVLLTGESGTGKEVIARLLHERSGRRGEFVAVHCAALTSTLLESELFGYEKGAFTGAQERHIGRFEAADGGTIFLDEIGEMAFDLQAKLLRILETGEFLKIGDTKPVKVNVRVIAATNRDLAKEIADGHFREDLFYRLSVFHIHLPPLRERVDDIPLHVEAFVSALSSKIGKTIRTISPDYVRILKRYPWKGNVRELRNVVERSLIISDGDTLTADTLPLTIQNPQDNTDSSYSGFDLDGVEKMHIQKVLKYTNGNKTETSRLLGIGLTTLYRKIEEYGL